MKMKFFERSYLITLVIFLLFFNCGIFALALYTYNNSVESAEQVCRSEQLYIAGAFENDYEADESTSVNLLMISYGTFYSEKNIKLRFAIGDTIRYTDITDDFVIPAVGELSTQRIDNTRYILITDTVCDGKYNLTYAKDVSYLDTELRSLALTFVLVSVAASVILAVLLYFVMRKLYSPLQKLRIATQEISSGELSARADESGDDEFSALAKDFNLMADKIGEQMDELKINAEQKQQMLDNLAHEMRTPLTSIYGYAEYVYGVELAPADRIKAMTNIMSESMRLRNISEKLLDSAFIRENGIEPHSFSVDSLLERTKTRFMMKASEQGVRINYIPCGISILGDETLIELLVSNLTDNAIRACRGKGIVELGATKENGITTIYVKDNGIGMTEEQLIHITEPFYRTDKSRSRRDGGTGLGLALCKRIAEAHKATLEFESTPSVGTTAYLRFEEEKHNEE